MRPIAGHAIGTKQYAGDITNDVLDFGNQIQKMRTRIILHCREVHYHYSQAKNAQPRGAACSRSRPQTPSPPPSPSRPPKVFEPVFLQFEILEKTTGAIGARNFF